MVPRPPTGNKWWPFLPALFWGGVIFVVISLPRSSIPEAAWMDYPRADKVIHFLLFAVLGALLLVGFTRPGRPGKKRGILLSLAAGCSYGALTELFQFCCLASRHGNMPDVLANCFGTVFGVLMMALFFSSWTKKGSAAEKIQGK